MGKNQIRLGWSGKITNHSLKKTLCEGLFNRRVNPYLTIQVSGHKTVQSINNYATANANTQKDLFQKIVYKEALGNNKENDVGQELDKDPSQVKKFEFVAACSTPQPQKTVPVLEAPTQPSTRINKLSLKRKCPENVEKYL